MKILICGGRDFADSQLLNSALEAAHKKHGEFCVIHGGARGADMMAGEWAQARGLPVIVMAANWNFHGKCAGPIRNQWMLDYAKPDAVIAMPGGVGTADMCRRAVSASIPVWEVQPA